MEMAYIQAENLKHKRTFTKTLIVLAPFVTALMNFFAPLWFQLNSYNWWYNLLYPGFLTLTCTYVINEEQAATIRMVFTLYSQGYGEKAIVNELSRLGRKDGHGNVSWSCTKISRILRNATYMGYICYNKSKVNNYLEKKRINNLDETSFVYVKGNFEPIVSEALWHECERIRKSRIVNLRLPDGETRRKGIDSTKYLWVAKLRCRCGSSYRIFNWRKLKDGTPVFGYQCNM